MRKQLGSSNFAAPGNAFVALAVTTLFAFIIALSACVYYLYAPEVDFVSFWAAGRLALGGHAVAAYDIQAHRGSKRPYRTSAV